ncbi:MAG: TIGR03086 family metal-binding protein [Microthrixaceae bacterium]
MEDLELLRLASDTFGERIAGVAEDQLYLPTPCGDWNVAGLITHVLGGNHMAVRLLEGAHRAEAIGYLTGLPLGDDPAATFEENANQQIVAFSEPGAMERICEHPMGDLPGAVILGFRIGDLTLHAWDLARAVGGNEELPTVLVEKVWGDLVPLRDDIASIGIFGDGPSGEVPEDAPLQTRLLDLVGRRP